MNATQELQRRAVAKWGDRLKVKGAAFVIDGVRLYVATRQRGPDTGFGVDNEWEFGNALTLDYGAVLDRLQAAFDREQAARSVSEPA